MTPTPPPPTRLHHVAIVVSDLARAEAFYTEVMRLCVDRRGDDDKGEPRSIWLTVGNSIVMLERAEQEEPRRGDEAPGLHCLALAIGVESRDAWREHFAAMGCPIERETAYSIYVRDPDGNLVAVSRWPVGKR